MGLAGSAGRVPAQPCRFRTSGALTRSEVGDREVGGGAAPGGGGGSGPGRPAPPLYVPRERMSLGGGTQGSWRAAVRRGLTHRGLALTCREVRWERRGER